MHARQNRLPCVISPRGSLFEERLRSLHKRFYLTGAIPLFNRHVSAFHALTEREARALRKAGLKRPIHVIPNYVLPPRQVEAGECRAVLGELGIDTNRRWLLNLGRIARGKGVTTLLKAFSRLPEATRGEWGIIIAGPDYRGYSREVRRCIAELGLRDHVVCCGNVAGAAKDAVFQAATVFVQLSAGEAMSNSVLEAMSHGLPVALSRECEMPAIEEQEAGWLIPRDGEGPSRKLQEILELCPADVGRAGSRARKLAQTEYSEKTVIGMYLQMYQEVLGA